MDADFKFQNQSPMQPMDLTLPLLGGLVLVMIIVVGTVVVLMRPSDLPPRS